MTPIVLAVIAFGIIFMIIRSDLRPSKGQLAARRAFTERAAALGWRKAESIDQWPLRLQGTIDGIAWTLSANAAAEEIDLGYTDPDDEIWWTTDAVRSPEYVMLIACPRGSVKDWTLQPGVQDPDEILKALKTSFDQLARSAESLDAMSERWRRDWPWVGIDDFVKQARDATPATAEWKDVVVLARDAHLSSWILDGSSSAALARCQRWMDVDARSWLRIWLGAPNLRLHLSTRCKDRKLEVFQSVVDLGVTLARNYQRATAVAATSRGLGDPI